MVPLGDKVGAPGGYDAPWTGWLKVVSPIVMKAQAMMHMSLRLEIDGTTEK